MMAAWVRSEVNSSGLIQLKPSVGKKKFFQVDFYSIGNDNSLADSYPLFEISQDQVSYISLFDKFGAGSASHVKYR